MKLQQGIVWKVCHTIWRLIRALCSKKNLLTQPPNLPMLFFVSTRRLVGVRIVWISNSKKYRRRNSLTFRRRKKKFFCATPNRRRTPFSVCWWKIFFFYRKRRQEKKIAEENSFPAAISARLHNPAISLCNGEESAAPSAHAVLAFQRLSSPRPTRSEKMHFSTRKRAICRPRRRRDRSERKFKWAGHVAQFNSVIILKANRFGLSRCNASPPDLPITFLLSPRKKPVCTKHMTTPN